MQHQTATREALIEKLVTLLHLNVPERQLLGPDPVSEEEVVAAVHKLFLHHGVFPPYARAWKPGDLVFEGHILIKRPDGRIDLVWQRNHPIRPMELAERTSTVYDDVDEAVRTFIDCEWSRGIDGIRLIRRSHPEPIRGPKQE